MRATLQLVLRKDKLNQKSGEAPIYLRIIKNRKVTNLSTGVRLEPKYWDDKRKRVKTSHPNSSRMNAILAKLLSDSNEQVLEVEQQDMTVSSASIKDHVLGRTSADLFELGNLIADRYNRSDKIGSRDKVKSILKKVQVYTKRSSMPLTDITDAFLRKYEIYLTDELHNRPNTVNKDMKLIRQIFNDALRQELITPKQNPFSRYKLPSERTTREFLHLEELEQMAACDLSAEPRLELYRDMFIFCAYAGGLRISDVLLLRWKNIIDGRLYIRIKKTQTPTSFLVPEKALTIAKARIRTGAADEFVFPVLEADLNLDDAEAVDKAISGATANANKALKRITEKTGIEKHLSFHCSRHSFAVNALKKDIGIATVSKILGHASIQETQVYAKIQNSELDKAMRLFDS